MVYRSRPNLRQKSTGIYHFRIRIPADLKRFFDAVEITHSLHTRDWRTALKAVSVHEQHTLQLFERLRSGMYTQEEMLALIQRFYDRRMAENDANRFGPNAAVYRASNQDLLRKGAFDRAILATKEALASYDPTALSKAARCLITELGIEGVEPGTPEFQQLGHMKLRADLKILNMEKKRAAGEFDNEHDSGLLSVSAASAIMPAVPTVQKRLFSDLLAQYDAEHVAAGNWTEKTRQSNLVACGYVIEVLGDKPAAEVTHEDMLTVRKALQAMPPNRTKDARYRKKSLKEILKMKPQETLSVIRVNNLLTRITGFFNWAQDHEYVERNPARRLKISTKKLARDARDSFDHDDLQKLVAALATQIKHPARYPERKWIPLIGLYTGMRINEICQMTVADVHELDGVLCFNVSDDDDKRLKNATAKRIIPVHDTLVELGFRDYLKGKQGQLWPNLKKERDGHQRKMSRWFSQFKAEHVTTSDRKVFHSLRHTFATQLQNAGVDPMTISELMGHAHGGQTLGRYAKGLKPAKLKEALDKLDYGLDLSALKGENA